MTDIITQKKEGKSHYNKSSAAFGLKVHLLIIIQRKQDNWTARPSPAAEHNLEAAKRTAASTAATVRPEY